MVYEFNFSEKWLVFKVNGLVKFELSFVKFTYQGDNHTCLGLGGLRWFDNAMGKWKDMTLLQ